jgi:hypothetical protein
MKFQRVPLAIAVVVVLAVIAGVTYGNRPAADGRSHSVTADVPRVDNAVPEHALLQDALDIATGRQSGTSVNFSYVPRIRPPDLLRMMGGGGGGQSVHGSYPGEPPAA